MKKSKISLEKVWVLFGKSIAFVSNILEKLGVQFKTMEVQK